MHIDLMPALYLPACAFFMQLVLCIVFLSKNSFARRDNKFFSWMLVMGVLDALLISVCMIISYIDYDELVVLVGWINKVDFLLYMMWAACFALYIFTIPSRNNSWFIANKSKLMVGLVSINIVLWLFILISPIESHSIEHLTFYATGLSTEIPLYTCTVYLVAVAIKVVISRKQLTRKYAAVPVVLGLLLLTSMVRANLPGLSVIPFAVALSNLVILLTFENPEAKLLDIERRNRNKIKRVDKAKDDFIAMASHQLRTPLTSIKGYISMLLEGDFGKLTAEQRRVLGEAYLSSERMAFIIGDFLDLSRLQTGNFELQKTPIRLDEILNSEISQLKTMADSYNIKLIYNPTANLPITNCDQSKMRQVMMNLIDNAIFYSHAGGQVEIGLYQKDKNIIFTVRDYGIGVPRAERPRLFEKFFRASNARQARPDGTGVGLYMARKVIIAHGGSIIFESHENSGSTFGFRLPIESSAS
jgi:signal transduction histidine kinase